MNTTSRSATTLGVPYVAEKIAFAMGEMAEVWIAMEEQAEYERELDLHRIYKTMFPKLVKVHETGESGNCSDCGEWVGDFHLYWCDRFGCALCGKNLCECNEYH